MRPIAGSVAVIFLIGAFALPAAAQAKDPFQPGVDAGSQVPPGSGAEAPGGRAVGGAPQEEPQGGGLPRTGLDYSLPFIAALGLLAAGVAMRLAGSALAG